MRKMQKTVIEPQETVPLWLEVLIYTVGAVLCLLYLLQLEPK